MTLDQHLCITEARKELAHLIDQVQYAGESFVIVRHGEPAAALVPMEVYQHWRREREELLTTIRQVREHTEGADPAEVLRDILAAQQAERADASDQEP